jgi:hypothetical protein
MIQAIVTAFFQTWLLGLVALLIGGYAGRQRKQMPLFFGPKVVIYLEVWAVTFLAKVAFEYLRHLLWFNEHIQNGFAEFLLPIVAGSFYAHHTLLRISIEPQ